MAITDELREYARAFDHVWFKSDGTAIFTTGIPPIDADRGDKHMLRIADRIDAEHAEAQRRWMAELDAAREQSFNAGFDDGFASADDWLAQHEDSMAEHGWVRKSKEHVVSHATVEVTPHIDWSHMADELNETLGAGTCRDVCNSVSEFTCSACGFNCDLMSWISLFDGDDGKHRHHHHGTPNFCPNCGRRVVE